MRRVVFDHKLLPYLLLAPQVIILGWFFFWPAGQAVVSAFTLTDAFGGKVKFVGLSNFIREFLSPEYHKAVLVTVIFTFITTFLMLVLGLLFALAVDRVLRLATIYRILMILPYAVAPAVAGVVWMFAFEPHTGILAYLIEWMTGAEWNPDLKRVQAMCLLVLASTWKQVSYNFVFFLAGLQSIPKSLIEAAAMDGAGPLRRVWDVMLPLLTPVTFFLVILNLVYALFETFGIVAVTTQGGPGDWTSILVNKVFRDGFIGLDYGASSAQSLVLMVVMLVLTFLQFCFVERRVHYKG